MNLLERASQIIEERGWCQNTEEDVNGGLCLYGAIRAAEKDLTGQDGVLFEDARDFVVAELSDRGVPEHTALCPSVWNDKPGREAYEVAEVLRFAGKRMEQANG